MSQFIIALDQGTTSSRAVLLDDKGMCLAIKQKEFRQIFPQQAWVEHDPKEIWETQEAVLNEILESNETVTETPNESNVVDLNNLNDYSDDEIDVSKLNLKKMDLGSLNVEEINFDSDDLGFDSLDTVQLVMDLEEEFDISIPDEDAEELLQVGQAIEYIKEQVD